ncbi:MAG TPA: hypothetical protein VGJ91_05055 [Polyangiaceae bacterium]
MIYRVEFRKDGSVASCAEVESQLRSGGLVCFVEADNRVSAIKRAKTKWAAWHRRSLNKSLCQVCQKHPRKISSENCAPCLKKWARRARELAAVRESETEESRTERFRKMRADVSARGKAVLNARSDALWDSFLAAPECVTSSHRSVLRQVLRAYDRSPATFREWLTLMLGHGQTAQAAE